VTLSVVVARQYLTKRFKQQHWLRSKHNNYKYTFLDACPYCLVRKLETWTID